MSPGQKKMVDHMVDNLDLDTEVVAALALLKEGPMTGHEFQSLVSSLAKAPVKADAEYAIGGILKR